MATLEELTTPLTRREVEASLYGALEARGVDTTAWKPGSPTRAVLTAVSYVLASFSALTAEIAKSGFLELAEGAWLVIVARFVYDVEKILGTFAAGDVELVNTGGGVFSVAAGDLIVKRSSNGKTYRSTAAFTLGVGESALVPVEALEIGTASTAPAGTIDDFETPLLGVTVSNPAALVGQDPESDKDLRQRCYAKLGTLSPNGPKDAYEFVARSATTTEGAPAGVTRVTTIADGTGGVTVYVANGGGALAGTLGDPSSPLGAVDEAIQTQVVPEGITATVVNADALPLTPAYELWVCASIGKTEGQLAGEIATALATYIGSLPIGGDRKVAGGGYVFIAELAAVVVAAVGQEHIIDLLFSVPGANVPVAANEAPTIGSVTHAIHLVSL